MLARRARLTEWLQTKGHVQPISGSAPGTERIAQSKDGLRIRHGKQCASLVSVMVRMAKRELAEVFLKATWAGMAGRSSRALPSTISAGTTCSSTDDCNRNVPSKF